LKWLEIVFYIIYIFIVVECIEVHYLFFLNKSINFMRIYMWIVVLLITLPWTFLKKIVSCGFSCIVCCKSTCEYVCRKRVNCQENSSNAN